MTMQSVGTSFYQCRPFATFGSSMTGQAVVSGHMSRNGSTVTPGSGFTELADDATTSSTIVYQTQYDNTSIGTGVDVSGLGGDSEILFAVELQEATGGGGGGIEIFRRRIEA